MGAPYNPSIEVEVGRGAGLLLQINSRAVDDTYGAIVMAELAQLCEFPAVRVEVNLRCRQRPAPAATARLIADELERNEIWEWPRRRSAVSGREAWWAGSPRPRPGLAA